MEMMTKSFRLRVNIFLWLDFNYLIQKFDKKNILIKFHFSVMFLGSGNGRAVLVLRKRLDYDSGERNFNLTIKAQVSYFSIISKAIHTHIKNYILCYLQDRIINYNFLCILGSWIALIFNQYVYYNHHKWRRWSSSVIHTENLHDHNQRRLSAHGRIIYIGF